MPFVTYAIRDPRTGAYVYVGQSGRLAKRIAEHLRCGVRPRARGGIKAWLHDTLASGVTPEFVELETAEFEEASLQSEAKWVKRLAREGHPLLNRWREHREIIRVQHAVFSCIG